MNIEFHSSRLAVSNSIQAYVERRIGFALGRFADVVESVFVSLEDINGPRGGVDKSCRIRVNLIGQKTPIIADVLDLEIRPAVDMAADRVGRAVARHLDRRAGRRSSERWIDSLQVVE
jgi:putative sigma-54 modulation protein